MKAVLILHNEAIDVEINEMLESAGAGHYTKFTDVLGRGQLSSPHLNTSVWPGKNYGTLVVVDEIKAREIMDKVRQLRRKLGAEGVKAFLWEIEEAT
jgi:nitrogen regulatory protein PII